MGKIKYMDPGLKERRLETVHLIAEALLNGAKNGLNYDSDDFKVYSANSLHYKL